MAKVIQLPADDQEEQEEYGEIDFDLEAQSITLNSLPAQSKSKYMKTYNNFIEWKALKTKNTNLFSESLLIIYFEELSLRLKSSSLWSKYSMLRSTLSTLHNVDISRYMKLKQLLKSKAKGFRPNKASVFSSDEIAAFLRDAPDEQYLHVKVSKTYTEFSLL